MILSIPKVYIKGTLTFSESCSKLVQNAKRHCRWRRSGVLIVNIEQFGNRFVLSLLLL